MTYVGGAITSAASTVGESSQPMESDVSMTASGGTSTSAASLVEKLPQLGG